MKINDVQFNKDRKSVVIIEGPQGVGKTGFANYCRENIPYSNLYRLTGNSDKTVKGYEKAKHMYYTLQKYLNEIENDDLNLIFDRTFFSEEAYCRLGYKDYSFSDVYFELVKMLNEMKLNIYVVFLCLENTELFRERLGRDKTKSFTQFTLDSSIEQQETYLKMAEELQEYDNINPIVVPTDDFDEAYKKLHLLLPPLSTKVK